MSILQIHAFFQATKFQNLLTCFYWIIGEDELVDGLKAFIEAIVNENVSLVISRQLLTDVATELVKIEDSVSKAVSHFTLEVVQPRVISFEEQVCAHHIFSRILNFVILTIFLRKKNCLFDKSKVGIFLKGHKINKKSSI